MKKLVIRRRQKSDAIQLGNQNDTPDKGVWRTVIYLLGLVNGHGGQTGRQTERQTYRDREKETDK